MPYFQKPDGTISYASYFVSEETWGNTTPSVIFTRDTEVYKMTIHYRNEEEFHVRNAYSIKVYTHKSGGYDIQYNYDYKKKEIKPYGVEITEADKEIMTTTHDVVAVTLETRKDCGVYRKEYVEFMK
jgi:hypothetical protein